MNPFCWIEIYVNDMARAVKFYENVLQIKLEQMTPPENDDSLEMYAFPSNMNAPNTSGALVKMDGFGAGGNGTIPYFACADCAQESSRIEAAGGKIYKSKFSINEYGFIAIASDSEGNTIGFHSLK